MPSVITSAVANIWFFTAKTLATGGFGAFLIKSAGVALLSLASSRLFAPEVPKGSGLRGNSVMSRSSLEYRRICYGQAPVSGPIVYNNTSGGDSQFLWYVIAMLDGESEELVSVWFDDEEITADEINWTPGVDGAEGVGDGAVSTSMALCLAA